jgi:hypothetical protein
MLKEDIYDINPEALLVDGFDEAIIGMAERINLGPVVAYDTDKIIKILADDMDDELDEDTKIALAYEYFEFNILGAWVGDNTPIFINKIEN